MQSRKFFVYLRRNMLRSVKLTFASYMLHFAYTKHCRLSTFTALHQFMKFE